MLTDTEKALASARAEARAEALVEAVVGNGRGVVLCEGLDEPRGQRTTIKFLYQGLGRGWIHSEFTTFLVPKSYTEALTCIKASLVTGEYIGSYQTHPGLIEELRHPVCRQMRERISHRNRQIRDLRKALKAKA